MILCKQVSVTKRMNVSWGNPTLDFYKIWETSKIPLNNLPQDLNVFFLQNLCPNFRLKYELVSSVYFFSEES